LEIKNNFSQREIAQDKEDKEESMGMKLLSGTFFEISCFAIFLFMLRAFIENIHKIYCQVTT